MEYVVYSSHCGWQYQPIGYLVDLLENFKWSNISGTLLALLAKSHHCLYRSSLWKHFVPDVELEWVVCVALLSILDSLHLLPNILNCF